MTGSAMATASFFYRCDDGTEVGPLTQSQLVAAASDATIQPSTFIRNDINGEWVRAGRVKGLFNAFHGGNAAEPKQPDPDSIYVIAQDKVHGPYERAQIQQFAEAGHINRNTILQIGKDGERKSAGEVLGGALAEPVTKQPDSKSASAVSSASGETGTLTKQCPFCAEPILADAIKCRYCNKFLDRTSDGDGQNTHLQKKVAPMPLDATPTKKYKVLTQKDKWFSGKFDPSKLEEALNAYAEQGWVVKSATTAAIPGLMGGNRDELIVILER